jgi:hypothetical protein
LIASSVLRIGQGGRAVLGKVFLQRPAAHGRAQGKQDNDTGGDAYSDADPGAVAEAVAVVCAI